MIIELYENGVNFLWPIVLKLTLLVFLIYVIPFLITYAKGERVCWCETSVKYQSFNPIKNREFSTIFVSPILLLITGIILSFTWILSIPTLIIFAIVHLIRLKNIHKQKMWDRLRGVK
jgi:hypothetical protein